MLSLLQTCAARERERERERERSKQLNIGAIGACCKNDCGKPWYLRQLNNECLQC